MSLGVETGVGTVADGAAPALRHHGADDRPVLGARPPVSRGRRTLRHHRMSASGTAGPGSPGGRRPRLSPYAVRGLGSRAPDPHPVSSFPPDPGPSPTGLSVGDVG